MQAHARDGVGERASLADQPATEDMVRPVAQDARQAPAAFDERLARERLAVEIDEVRGHERTLGQARRLSREAAAQEPLVGDALLVEREQRSLHDELVAVAARLRSTPSSGNATSGSERWAVRTSTLAAGLAQVRLGAGPPWLEEA